MAAADYRNATVIDLAGLTLPANVMLPNSSSTLWLGNRLDMSDGKGEKGTTVSGVVTRITKVADGTIFLEVSDGDPLGKGELQGRVILFPSGMLALVAKESGK
jgi:hypothetical protein